MKRILILLPLAFLLCACSSKSGKGCILPPQQFTPADLVGTWTAGWSDDKDTLIIRADGTYKQLIHLTAPAFAYESSWQPWRVEYHASGLPYLHMQGMRLCAYGGAEIVACNQVGGGTGNSGYWYDPCQNTWLQMPGEGVLITLGTPKGFVPPPRGIILFLPMKGSDAWSYGLQPPSAAHR